MPRGVNPKLTERYLLGVDDVLDASVWWHGDGLRACVVVSDEQDLADKDLQSLCMSDLGLHQTPKAITMVALHGSRPYSSSSSGGRSSIAPRSSPSLVA